MLSRIILPLVMIASLSACVSNSGHTDVRGRSLKLENKGSFTPTESRFNSFAFLKASSDYITESEERNNGQAWHETISWDSGRSFIYIQFVNTSWFSPGTERSLADVNNFMKTARSFPVSRDSFIELDKISPRTRGWLAKTDKCSVGAFVKRLKQATPYDNDRGLPDAIVRFGTCGDKLNVTPEEFASSIDLITENDKETITSAFSGLDQLPGQKFSLATISGSWDGLVDGFSGLVTRETKDQIEFTFFLVNGNAECTGTTVNALKTTLTGRWAIECSNGLTADGIWTNRPGQTFVASGSDTEKRRVVFELGS